jgi:hypothetical protein
LSAAPCPGGPEFICYSSSNKSWVLINFDDLFAVQLDASPLAYDFGWEDKILEDCLVHGGESSRAGTLLAQRLAVLAALWLRQNPSLQFWKFLLQYQYKWIKNLGNKDDMTAAHLLLQLTHQLWVNLLVVPKLRNRDPDEDAFFGAKVKLLK